MKVILVETPGQLSIGEAPDPTHNGEDILVDVKAIGVNHADLLQAHGKYPPPPGVSETLGLEIAGVAQQVGKNVRSFKPGDRVMCLLPGGGYAEKVAVHEKLCMRIPANLSFEKAAAIPEVFLTAYQALFLIGEIQPKQWILIHAAAGGVGTAALQLAREAGARTIATSRTQDKLEKLLQLGADSVINTQTGSFHEKILNLTENHGADLILDFIGASYFDENMKALSQGGAILFLATMGGRTIEKFDLRLLMSKWATLSGTTLRSRPLEYKARLIEEFNYFTQSRFEENKLRPIIDKVMPWEKAQEAHNRLKDNKAFGKIVLTV